MKNQATILLIFSNRLREDNKPLIKEYKIAKNVQTQLRLKYEKTNKSIVNYYLRKLQDFLFNKNTRINILQTKLKEYYYKLVLVNKLIKATFLDSALLLLLTKKLPEIYQATKDSFRVNQSYIVKEKIRILKEVEVEY